MSLLVMLGFGLIIPALPLLATKFDVKEAGAGLVLTAFSVTRLMGDLFAGGLIDRFGERVVTAIGVAVVGVSSIAAGAAQSYVQLVVLRGLGGFGSAFFLGGLLAYLIGTIPEDSRGRAMGVFQAAIGIGILIGPLVGGIIIAVSSENIPLYVYGAVCLASIPIALRALGGERIPSDALTRAPSVDENVPGPAEHTWKRMRPLFAISTYRAALAVSGLVFLITSALQTVIPLFWVGDLGLSKGTTGIPFMVTALAALVVVWHAGALSDRRGRKFALVPALAVMAVATALLGFTMSAVVVVALMGVHGAASGYMRPGPTAMVADVAPPDARGVAVSGYRIAGDVGSLLGPIMAGALAEFVSLRAAFLALAAIAMIVFVMAARAEETAPSRRTA